MKKVLLTGLKVKWHDEARKHLNDNGVAYTEDHKDKDIMFSLYVAAAGEKEQPMVIPEDRFNSRMNTVFVLVAKVGEKQFSSKEYNEYLAMGTYVEAEGGRFFYSIEEAADEIARMLMDQEVA